VISNKENERSWTKITTYVRSDIWIAFRNYVLNKHGKIRGALYRELTEALKYYMDSLAEARTCISEQHGFIKASKKHENLLNYIYDFDEITLADIKSYIHRNIGIDKRTFRKYLNFLVNGKFIVVLKYAGYNIIYKVNKGRIAEFLGIEPPEAPEQQHIEPPESVEEQSAKSVEFAQYLTEEYRAGKSIDELAFAHEMHKQAVKRVIQKYMREVENP
jgi:hypothetical protein